MVCPGGDRGLGSVGELQRSFWGLSWLWRSGVGQPVLTWKVAWRRSLTTRGTCSPWGGACPRSTPSRFSSWNFRKSWERVTATLTWGGSRGMRTRMLTTSQTWSSRTLICPGGWTSMERNWSGWSSSKWMRLAGSSMRDWTRRSRRRRIGKGS